MVIEEHLLLKERGSNVLLPASCVISALSLCCWAPNPKLCSCHTSALHRATNTHGPILTSISWLPVLCSEDDEFLVMTLQFSDYLYSPIVHRKIIYEKKLNIEKAKPRQVFEKPSPCSQMYLTFFEYLFLLTFVFTPILKYFKENLQLRFIKKEEGKLIKDIQGRVR